MMFLSTVLPLQYLAKENLSLLIIMGLYVYVMRMQIRKASTLLAAPILVVVVPTLAAPILVVIVPLLVAPILVVVVPPLAAPIL